MALQCFVTLSQKLGPSTMLIVKTATNFARRNNRSPFTELVHSLNLKWDVETRFYALQLINSLIVRCPSEKKIAQFVARLENIGLYDELRSLSQIKDHPKIRLQLQNFQVSTKQLLPSLAFENEVHKCRLKQQTQHIELLESKVEHYVEQQGLLALMREDLAKYK